MKPRVINNKPIRVDWPRDRCGRHVWSSVASAWRGKCERFCLADAAGGGCTLAQGGVEQE